jgi:hypothetical protein
VKPPTKKCGAEWELLAQSGINKKLFACEQGVRSPQPEEQSQRVDDSGHAQDDDERSPVGLRRSVIVMHPLSIEPGVRKKPRLWGVPWQASQRALPVAAGGRYVDIVGELAEQFLK